MISAEFSPLPIPVRLGILQRVLPLYRLPFFETLAVACPEGLGVFSGQPRAEEAIETASSLKDVSLFPAQNHHLFFGKFYLCLQTGLMRWLEEWQPQVLILEANPRYLSSPAAVRWMHHRRRPVIGWGLGQPHTSLLLSPARRGFLRQFDALITYSRTGAEEYSAAGYPPQRIFVAPNAAAPRPAAPPPERAEQVERPTVLFTGRLQARKRVDYLLQACAALPPTLQPRLIIVGEGPEKPALQALAGKIYPAAQFPGALFNEDLAPYLQQADLFVLPGTGGLAVQQAMAAALPVMAAEADGTQADLVRLENGWRLIPGDLAGLINSLASALGDIPRLRRMGLESYRIVRDEINLEAMVAAFGRAIAFVLGGKHAHPLGG